MKDFKAFIMRGNVIDMAVGIIIGAAFAPIIASFVNDVLMPPIGLLLGDVDFANLFAVLKEGPVVAGPYASLVEAKAAGAISINYGVFINTIINFIIIAAVIFFFVVRPIGKMRAKQTAAETPAAPATKQCPYCYSNINIAATRCPNCTSELRK